MHRLQWRDFNGDSIGKTPTEIDSIGDSDGDRTTEQSKRKVRERYNRFSYSNLARLSAKLPAN